jgi:cation diffusion facilitator CzcD-associated flavoprotein CzcO
LRGKRVAVIGTGASAVQIIQTIGPEVGHLTVFQRTPNNAIPMRNSKLTTAEQSADKATVIERTRGWRGGGFPWKKRGFEVELDLI